jgi:hypothetical protein
MNHRMSVRWVVWVLVSMFAASDARGQGRSSAGTVAGVVATESGAAVSDASISIARTDGTGTQTATSDARGAFRIGSLAPGLYRLTARRIGYREAERLLLRVTSGRTSEVRITLTASPTLLSTVEVRETPTSIDASSTELARRIDIADVSLLPMGRTAASLLELVPGARNGFVWGGAGDAANNYQLDGIAMNHPGTGGDFLSPSIDWVEALEVRGLGAGAEHGGFQGGIVNAITKTGSNEWSGAVRGTFISPALTGSNILPNEEGAEQSMRREIGADAGGAIIRDRLFYFVGGLVIDRKVDVPELVTAVPDDVRPFQQEFRDVRGIGKLTLRPGPFDRIDALAGYTDSRIERSELNGIDDPAASKKVRSPTTFYELAWARNAGAGGLHARIGGFRSEATSLGYAGENVPGVQVFYPGRQPLFQNATFNDRNRPGSLSAGVSWRREHTLLGGINRFVVGADLTRGSWKRTRTRNGGMTWFPYVNPATNTVDPGDASTWVDAASEWGGEIRVDSEVQDAALFVQDYFSLSPHFTLTPGLRLGQWKGWLTPADGSSPRFLAASDAAIDPRIGLVWDITGRTDFVVKAHLGTYHQAMSSLFFDRAAGANAYANERFYLQGPAVSDSRTTFTPAERDANLDPFTGFSPTFSESILNEAGDVVDYRQPYVRQAVISVEKRIGSRFKIEASYVNRVNKDIVGLVDRNLEQNYSRLTNVQVRNRVTQTPVYDQFGNPLILPELWVSNAQLRNALILRRDGMLRRPPIEGFTFADIDHLTFEPDIVLTTVPDARRVTNQVSVALRTDQREWSAFASATFTDLRGTVDGLTGFGTTSNGFTAGPGVRRNERVNYRGRLGNIPAFDSKAWLTGRLPGGIQAGILVNYSLGEYLAPAFRITPRYRFLESDRGALEDALFAGVLGQTILIEERGTRKYPQAATVNLRGEKRFEAKGVSYVVSGDLFNAFASDAIIERNLTVNDAISTDPTSLFGAPRRRVTPIRFQIGLRVER